MAIGTPTDLGGSNIAATATTSTISLTTTGAANAGDKVIVVVGSSTINRTLSSVSDSVGGNTWVINKTQNDAVNPENCYVASSLLSNTLPIGTVITATFATSVSSARGICAFVVSQLGAVDVINSNSNTSSGWDGGTTGTLGSANELVVGAAWRTATTTSTPSGSQSMTELFDFNGSSKTMTVVYRIVTATTAVLPGGTFANSGSRWQAITATYQQGTQSSTSTLTPTASTAPTLPRVVGKSLSNF